MLLLFPEGFWYDTVIYCAVTIALLVAILGILAGAYLIYRRRKNGGSTVATGS